MLAQIYLETVTYFMTEMPPRIKQMTRRTRNARLIRVMPSSKGHLNTLQSFTCVHPIRKCQSRSICHFFTANARTCEGFWYLTSSYWKYCRQWKASDQMEHNVKIFLRVKWMRGLVKRSIRSFRLPGKNVPICFWDFGWKIWKIDNALCRQLS